MKIYWYTLLLSPFAFFAKLARGEIYDDGLLFLCSKTKQKQFRDVFILRECTPTILLQMNPKELFGNDHT